MTHIFFALNGVLWDWDEHHSAPRDPLLYCALHCTVLHCTVLYCLLLHLGAILEPQTNNPRQGLSCQTTNQCMNETHQNVVL